ncbi:unnamed protein product, partial [Amoebophrya sp. A25]
RRSSNEDETHKMSSSTNASNSISMDVCSPEKVRGSNSNVLPHLCQIVKKNQQQTHWLIKQNTAVQNNTVNPVVDDSTNQTILFMLNQISQTLNVLVMKLQAGEATD